MKRIIVLAAASFLMAPTLAAECKPVEKFKVGKNTYKLRSAQESLDHLLRATPYKGTVTVRPEVMVKARRISGPLALSLDALAAQTGTHWQQEGCAIRFVEKEVKARAPQADSIPVVSKITLVPNGGAPAKPPAPTWTLRVDTPIHLQFAEWAQRAGWHFEWRLEKSWIVPATAQFSGSFDEAIAQAVEGLYAQGKPVRLILWEGNRFAEIVDVDAK